MANHIKAGMLIEEKVYVVHIETINSISTMEKNVYAVHIKINMFTTETREKKDILVCLLLNTRKNVVLHILKLVCLLQK